MRALGFATLLSVCAACATAPPPAPPPASLPAAETPLPVAEPVTEAPDPLCATITELNAAYFAEASADLDAEARIRLDENLQVLDDCPTTHVTVNGYADWEEMSPDSLSQARADAVATYLTRAGVGAERVRTVGRGVDPGSGGEGSEAQQAAEARRGRHADSVPNPPY